MAKIGEGSVKQKIKPSIIVDEKKIEPTIEKAKIKEIETYLQKKHPELIVQAMKSEKAEDDLRTIIQNIPSFSAYIGENSANMEYVLNTIVGTGVFTKYMRDRGITDIDYNGDFMTYETNDSVVVHEGEVTEEEVASIIQRFVRYNNTEFTGQEPIFDGMFDNARINAVHKKNTTHGTTMSLRMAYPSLSLKEDNFSTLAPDFVLDLFKTFVKLKLVMIISGETGTGKTALQKLMVSWIPWYEKIILIEEVAEMYLQEMFPNKRIFSWIKTKNAGYDDLITATVRNHPSWTIFAEVRDSAALSLIINVSGGQKLVTTIHSTSAADTPDRLVFLSLMGKRQINEEILKDQILRIFDVDIHIRRKVYNGKVYRYLEEVMLYSPEGNVTIFEQKWSRGEFKYRTRPLPEALKELMYDEEIDLKWPEMDDWKVREAIPNGTIRTVPVKAS